MQYMHNTLIEEWAEGMALGVMYHGFSPMMLTAFGPVPIKGLFIMSLLLQTYVFVGQCNRCVVLCLGLLRMLPRFIVVSVFALLFCDDNTCIL